jgi:hypothetical protein
MVTFIGRDGRELQRSAPLVPGTSASYQLAGDEQYVRARIAGPDGSTAWTPAVFVKRGKIDG